MKDKNGQIRHKNSTKNLKILSDAGFTLIVPARKEIKPVNSIDVFVNNEYSITISPPPGISKQQMFFRYDLENHRNKKLYTEQMLVIGGQSFLLIRRDLVNTDYRSFGYHLFQYIKGRNEELKGATFNFDAERRLFIPAD